jgi:hypothetical protein
MHLQLAGYTVHCVSEGCFWYRTPPSSIPIIGFISPHLWWEIIGILLLAAIVLLLV